MKLKYRVGLDLGANSLGWCVYALNKNDAPCRIVRAGARVFSDGRGASITNYASLAANRRAKRQARRRRDRVLKRRHRMMAGLIKYGLMPTDEAERKALQAFDPYQLRAEGLDRELAPYEMGRALYHLARKRGFKSSRKDRGDSEKEKETGKVKVAIRALRERVVEANCRTVGEYLAKQHAERKPVRARRSNDGQYVMYLQRRMVEEEFDQLWAKQQFYHPQLLTDEARDFLKDTLLFQRRLLPVQSGLCLFETTEFRAPLCSPLHQRFRILQELNNLRLTEGVGTRPLSLEERNILLNELLHTAGKITFPQLAQAIGFGRRSGTRFNLESEKRKDLKGDATVRFADPEVFGNAWFGFDGEMREALALLVERADQDAFLREALLALPNDLSRAEYVMRPFAHERPLLAALGRLPGPITEAQTHAIANIHLPDDFGNLSRKALSRIIPELEREVVTYNIAVDRAGYGSHSQRGTGEFFQRMPYYGEVLRGYTSPAEKAGDDNERKYGKIPNPTVHIGLNQLRLLMNALIRRYGHPHEIVIELTREFGLSGERRREIEKEQAENQARNEMLDQRLNELRQSCNFANRLKLRLWDELGVEDPLVRQCVYSGTTFNVTTLLSDEIEIDHILPFSRSLHDGIGNKILCTRQANRDKGNRTPSEAFGHSPGRYHWEDIQARVERLFATSGKPSLRRKAEYFKEDALDTFLGDKNFLARHLSDTAYLSRAAKQYLCAICPENFVWVSSGKLTGMLRSRWGLPKLLWDDGTKNRNDHRHHALDAAVIGLCDRSLIQRMANSAKLAEERGGNRLLEWLELPWAGFREELKGALERAVVSHKPDHGKQAALHNDTNYALRGTPDGHGNPLVGRHVPIESIKAANVDAIPDSVLRDMLHQLLTPRSSPRDIKAALVAFSERTGVRRVMLEERLSVIPIHDRRTGKPYRYVKGDGNYCREIYRTNEGQWASEKPISSFDANKPGFIMHPDRAQNGAPLVMRLCKRDMIALEIDGRRKIMVIASFTPGGVAMYEHCEANADARSRDKTDPFDFMRKSPEPMRRLKARHVTVDPLGYVIDPGFHE